MSRFWTPITNFIGLNEEPEQYEEEYEEEKFEEDLSSYTQKKPPIVENEDRSSHTQNREKQNFSTEVGMISNTRSNVIGMPGVATGMSEVVVIEPHSFEEMPKVIETLRDRRSVILNLNVMEPEEAQRAVDFVAGGTYAIDGHQERIGECIFLFTPSCVKVSTLTGVLSEVMETGGNPSPSTNPSTRSWTPETSRIAQ